MKLFHAYRTQFRVYADPSIARSFLCIANIRTSLYVIKWGISR
jgi:hypothetical protein